MLIGLNGYARSGKDTVADHLVATRGFKKVRFSDAIAESLYALNPLIHWEEPAGDSPIQCYERLQVVIDELGWEQAKVEIPEIRALMQRLGYEAGPLILGDDLWLRPVLAQARFGDVVVTGCRRKVEADAFREAGGFIVRVNRPGVSPALGHPVESELDGYDFDYTIENSGSIEDLNLITDLLYKSITSRAA